MRSLYTVGHSTVRSLRRVVDEYGASEVELAALDRLERFEATYSDLEVLEDLAEFSDVKNWPTAKGRADE